jgi:O-antigen ligase
LLLLGFVGLQLVALPIWLLRLVSPARVALSQSVGQAFPGATSLTISVYPSATLAQLLRVAAYLVVFVMVRELAWRTHGRRWLIIAPILIVAGAEAVLGILQYSREVAHGTYANPNHFAGLLELSLPFALAYSIGAIATGRYQSLSGGALVSVSVAIAALIWLGIIFSLSRTGFVASLSSLFLVASLAPGSSVSTGRRFAWAAVIAAALSAISFYLAPDALIHRFGEVGGTWPNLFGEPRARVWTDTWGLISDYRLVGCGLGAFEQAFPPYRTYLPALTIDTVHNDYLQFLAELGGIGFVIAAFGMIALVLSAIYAIFRSADPFRRDFAIASFAALVAILIHSFTDFNFYIPANAMLFAWIAGLVASLNFSSQKRLESR